MKNEAFGKRLKKLRIKAGFTQKELARNLHIELSTIKGYESFKRLPRLMRIIEIAKFFNVRLNYLIGLED